MVRIVDPEGRLTIVDFERELAQEHPLLIEVAKITQTRNRTRATAADAAAEWRSSLLAAAEAGLTPADIARAAGTTIAHIRAILAKR